jgi:hypothetical protein
VTTETGAPTLCGFLLARIAEDEAAVRPVADASPRWARRMRAECEAKRRIVARHASCGTGVGYCDDGGHGWSADMPGCADLSDLAAVYADHSDYRTEWDQ